MNDQKLILLVQEKSEIYDKLNPLHRYPDKKREAWKKISYEMETTEEEVIRRWTCLRDRFTKECKKIAKLSKTDKYYVWPYFDMMEFIRPHVITRQRVWNPHRVIKKSPPSQPSSPTPSLSPQLSPEPLYEHPRTPSPTTESEDNIQVEPMIDTPSLHKSRNSNLDVDKIFIEAIETLKKACSTNHVRHANPAVHAFGEMIVSTICSMNGRNQIKAMQQVTDLVMKIKLEDELLV